MVIFIILCFNILTNEAEKLAYPHIILQPWHIHFLPLIRNTSCVDSQCEACGPKKCGGQNISYPFWIQDEQESYCGYPGFELTCHNNHSILLIPENNYTVQEIFYDSQSIRISVSNLSSECLPPIRNLSLEVSKFKFASSDIPYLHILSNCSLSLPGGLSDYNRISCGAENEDVWGLALEMLGNNKNLSYALGKCKTQVLAPVELNGYDGFDASSYRFLCFCKDGPHCVSCITRSKRNLEVEVAIGSGNMLPPRT